MSTRQKVLSFIFAVIVLLPLSTINVYALTLDGKKDSVNPLYNQTDDDGYTKKLLSQTLYEIIPLVDSDVRGCAQDALVNVLGYWNDKGCKIFEADGSKIYCKDIDYNSSEPVAALLDTATKNFGTVKLWNTRWTPIWEYASGISKTLSDYKLRGTVNCYYTGKITFDLIKNEIDNDRPCIVGHSIIRSSNLSGHTVCVLGYKKSNSVTGKNYLIYVDSSGIVKEQVWYPNSPTSIGILCTINLQCSETTTTTTAVTSSTTTTATATTTTTTAKGDLDASACNATGALSVRASAPRYRTENGIKYCVADMYVKNNGSEAVGLIGFIAVNNRWSSWAPYILPGEEQEGYQYWQAYTDINKNDLHQEYYYVPKITALYCDDSNPSDPCSGCFWIYTYVNDNQQLPEGMQTIDIDSVNPCKGKAP